MKISILVFTFLFSFSLFANNTESKIEYKSEKVKCSVDNYEICLKHENRGVVESALTNVIKFKYRCPKADFECIFQQLKVLSEQSKNENISRKAELVLQILQNPELITEIGNNFYSGIEQYLDAILLNSRFEQELSLTLTP